MANSAITQSGNPERTSVRGWLSRAFTWCIPVYQRHYAWTTETDKLGTVDLLWQTIEEQTKNRLERETLYPHYLGAIIVDNKTQKVSTNEGKIYEVVDGQQRLTTISIALCALVKACEEFKVEGVREELAKYIFFDDKYENPRVVPTNFDREHYNAALYYAFGRVPQVERKGPEKGQSPPKIVSTFNFFEKQFKLLIKSCEKSHNADVVIQCVQETLLDGFDLVVIALEEHDDAQIIFESINNTKTELTTFDLIRNDVFYRASNREEDVVSLYGSDNWRALEDRFWEGKSEQRKGGTTHIEAYIARMLVAKMTDQEDRIKFNRNDIVKTYKKFSKKFHDTSKEIESVIEYVDVYKYLNNTENRNPLGDDFNFGMFRHEIWQNRDFYPVLFTIAKSNTSIEDKQKSVRLLESYVIRRAVCRLSAEPYNLEAEKICKVLRKSLTYDSLREQLHSYESDTNKFPTDDHVLNGCIRENFYKFKLRRVNHYILEEIAKRMQPDGIDVDIRKKLTIDHILPQNWKKHEGWRKYLNVDDKNVTNERAFVIDSHIHTIGNLTLMSGKWNSSKSDKPYEDAVPFLKGSGLKMNKKIARNEKWGVDEIAKRSKKLSNKICKRWPYDIS